MKKTHFETVVYKRIPAEKKTWQGSGESNMNLYVGPCRIFNLFDMLLEATRLILWAMFFPHQLESHHITRNYQKFSLNTACKYHPFYFWKKLHILYMFLTLIITCSDSCFEGSTNALQCCTRFGVKMSFIALCKA